MKTIYQLKPAFQRLLRPLSNCLAEHNVTPNQVTVCALALSIFGGLLILNDPEAVWPLLVMPIILLIRMVLNAIDGMIAREYKQQSALGTFLNEIGDVVSDAFLYLPFALIPGVDARYVVVIVVLSIISEMCGVVAIQIGGARRYDGPMGKSDRAFAFGLISVLLAINLSNLMIINIILGIVTALLIVTIVNRIYHAVQEVET